MSSNFSQIPPLTEVMEIQHIFKDSSRFLVLHSSAFTFDWIFFIPAGNHDYHKSSNDSNFDQIGLLTTELTAIERLEKSLYIYNGRNAVTTIMPSFLNGPSSFLQVTRTTIKLGLF